jgi:hypothetical protein
MKIHQKDLKDPNSLKQAMAAINKQFGEDFIMKLGMRKRWMFQSYQ